MDCPSVVPNSNITAVKLLKYFVLLLTKQCPLVVVFRAVILSSGAFA